MNYLIYSIRSFGRMDKIINYIGVSEIDMKQTQLIIIEQYTKDTLRNSVLNPTVHSTIKCSDDRCNQTPTLLWDDRKKIDETYQVRCSGKDKVTGMSCMMQFKVTYC